MSIFRIRIIAAMTRRALAGPGRFDIPYLD